MNADEHPALRAECMDLYSLTLVLPEHLEQDHLLQGLVMAIGELRARPSVHRGTPRGAAARTGGRCLPMTTRLMPPEAARAPGTAGYAIVRCLSGPRPERRARHLVTHVLAAAGVEAELADVELAVSELVTNAHLSHSGFVVATTLQAAARSRSGKKWQATATPARTDGRTGSTSTELLECYRISNRSGTSTRVPVNCTSRSSLRGSIRRGVP